MNKILILLSFLILSYNSEAKEFNSKFNFSFKLPDGYQLFNQNNLYDVYNHSNKDPLIKIQLDLAKKRLKNQDIELLYNFSSSPLNNITILMFNEDYEMSEKKVLKFCKKILKLEKKVGKRKVKLNECRMHKYPIFANWSVYRENESSFMQGATTQQIIFMFKKKEFVITSGCWKKCEQTKKDLFKMIETIEF